MNGIYTLMRDPTDVDITTLSSYKQLTFTDGKVTNPIAAISRTIEYLLEG